MGCTMKDAAALPEGEEGERHGARTWFVGKKAFTIAHFDGYPSLLIQLKKVGKKALRETITDAWLSCAPARLTDAYTQR